MKVGKIKQTQNGFTLIELSIVFLVIGLIALPFIQEYQDYARSNAEFVLGDRFYNIEKAVQEYYEKNGFLPCPAENFQNFVDDGAGGKIVSSKNSTLNIYRDADDFGTENCSAFVEELNDPKRTVLIGSVPVRALNLNAEQALDSWNRKIRFVVSKHMLNIKKYSENRFGDDSFFQSLNDPGKIEFFARSSTSTSCNDIAIGGFQEKYIARDVYYKNALLSGDNPHGITVNTQRPSELITSNDKVRDVVIINDRPSEMVEDICGIPGISAGDINLAFQESNPDGSGGYLDILSDAQHVLLISHGPSGAGAYNAEGALVEPCDDTAHDGMNCDLDVSSGPPYNHNIFYTNGFELDSGDNNIGSPDFYDDIVSSFRADSFKLFTASRPNGDTATADSYSPFEVIGIATDDPMGGAVPLEDDLSNKLPGIDVGGQIIVEANDTGDGDGRALASTICDQAGRLQDDSGNCFSPSIIAGEGIECAGGNNAMLGISNNNADCFDYTPFETGSSCLDPDEYVVGINPDGTVICAIPPAPP